MMKIIKAKDYKDMSRKAANILSAQVILKPDSVLGLATGSTPIGMYKQLIDWYRKGDIDFSKVSTFNLDEYVGLDDSHPQSYRKFMQDNFFNDVNINSDNIYIPNGIANNYDCECRNYENRIALAGGIDLQVLGIGHNGHIGFNEPKEHFERDTHIVCLKYETRKANSRFFGKLDDVPRHAISMGMGIIMKAKRIILLASGERKAEILHKSMYGKIDPYVPASILQLHPDITVVADENALQSDGI